MHRYIYIATETQLSTEGETWTFIEKQNSF